MEVREASIPKLTEKDWVLIKVKAAGVSESAASLTLNDSPSIKDETKVKIKTVAKGMGYFPNIMAKNLSKNANHTIGIIVPNIESVYYSKIVKIIDEKVRHSKYSLVVDFSNNSQRLEKNN